MSTQCPKTIEMEDARANSAKIQIACMQGTATDAEITAANDRLSIAIDEWRRTYSVPAYYTGSV